MPAEPATKPSELRDILAVMIPSHEPALIVGEPGIGKTDIIGQACKAASAQLITMHPVVSDPTDFKGMPWIDSDGAHFKPFGELMTLITANGLTWCFLDDLGQAPQAVQAAAMQLILARRINGHCVSNDVVFIAATNRRQDRAGVSGLLQPLKSPFTIL